MNYEAWVTPEDQRKQNEIASEIALLMGASLRRQVSKWSTFTHELVKNGVTIAFLTVKDRPQMRTINVFSRTNIMPNYYMLGLKRVKRCLSKAWGADVPFLFGFRTGNGKVYYADLTSAEYIIADMTGRTVQTRDERDIESCAFYSISLFKPTVEPPQKDEPQEVKPDTNQGRML